MKLAILIAVLAIVAYSAAEFKCEAGVSYRENDCNNCLCSETQVLGCTYKYCNGDKFDKLRACEVEKTWDEACNKCVCLANQGTICTNKEC